MLISLADVNAIMAALHRGLTCTQVDGEKVYNNHESLATHIVTPVLEPPSDLRQLLSGVKEDMAMHLRLSLCIDTKEGIWSYYKLVQITPLVFNDSLVVILQIPLVDRSL